MLESCKIWDRIIIVGIFNSNIYINISNSLFSKLMNAKNKFDLKTSRLSRIRSSGALF